MTGRRHPADLRLYWADSRGAVPAARPRSGVWRGDAAFSCAADGARPAQHSRARRDPRADDSA